VRGGLDSSDSAKVRSCEDDHGSWVKGNTEFLDQLSNYQLLSKDPAVRS
jgi:hypothetical protein